MATAKVGSGRSETTTRAAPSRMTVDQARWASSGQGVRVGLL